MNFRRPVVACLGSLLLLSGLTARPLSAAPAAALVARVHWLGMNQISADANAVQVMKVWRLPETTALVAQTLDKLSRRPGGGATNAASALLRPLLDDLITSESYVEVYAPPNSSLSAGGVGRGEVGLDSSTLNSQPSTLLLALRLPADRARLWQNNLPAALPTATLSKSGDWTLVSLGADTAGRLPDFAARLASTTTTHFWFEADLDPSRLAAFFSFSARPTGGEVGEVESSSFSAFRLPLSAFCSQVSGLHFTVTGEAGNVLTRGSLDFSRPLALTLSPWEIPTNYIHQPLSSFTAVRGLAPWLATVPVWQDLQLTPAPDQVFVWAQPGIPSQTYFAFPLPAADGQLARLAARLMQNGNLWLVTNGIGHFQWSPSPPALLWNHALPLSNPVLKPARFNGHDYVLGGLSDPFTGHDRGSLSDGLLQTLFGIPNLVYYHFEQTGSRVEDGLFVLQFGRLVFHKAQLPPAGALWLKKMEPLLGASATVVAQTGREQLAFTRNSTLGLTAQELHLLADWLESPQFPQGLHTFLAPPTARFARPLLNGDGRK